MLKWILLGGLVLHIFLSLYYLSRLLRERREPVSTLAWLLAIVNLPIIGVLIYWMVGGDKIPRKVRDWRRVAGEKASRSIEDLASTRCHRHPGNLAPRLQPIARMGSHLVNAPVTGCNSVAVIGKSMEIYDKLAEMMESAKDHIHMQYYIWRDDDTGQRFVDIATRKAKEGVEVRILIDAGGSLLTPMSFFDPVIEAGGEVELFLEFGPLQKYKASHMRNHRKIVVIDGEKALSGSQNVGDEYVDGGEHWPNWFDCNLYIEGPAVLFLQYIFCVDWFFACEREIKGDKYFPELEPEGDVAMQVIGTGPDQEVRVIEHVFSVALSTAQKKVRLVTPYFVPSDGFMMELKNACFRGVDIEVIIPRVTDEPIVLWAARSYYEELIEAGITFKEFDQGMIHSKIATFDDEWALIGSANLDHRSFRLNFETSMVVYDAKVVTDINAVMDFYDKGTVDLRDKDKKPQSRMDQITQGAARLLSPLI